VDVIIRELEALKESIDASAPGLEDKLRQVKEARDGWQKGAASAEPPAAPEPSGGWGHFFLGNLLSSPTRPGRRGR